MQPEKQLVNKTALFVLGSYTMGGIQSNFTRLLPYLVEKGLKVRVLVITDKVEESFLPLLSNVELLFYRDYLPLRMLGLNSSAILHSCPLVNKDLISCLADTQYIHAVDSETMILSSRIAAKLGVPLSVGCYHPREFTWEADDYYFRKAQHEMYQRLPPQNRVFFNEEVLAATSGFHKSSDFTGCVIPLTINCMEPAIKSITSKKIVSIGRLVKFKSYNEHMIKCLDVINDTYGMDFEYHIYGDGQNPYRQENSQKIPNMYTISNQNHVHQDLYPAHHGNVHMSKDFLCYPLHTYREHLQLLLRAKLSHSQQKGMLHPERIETANMERFHEIQIQI